MVLLRARNLRSLTHMFHPFYCTLYVFLLQKDLVRRLRNLVHVLRISDDDNNNNTNNNDQPVVEADSPEWPGLNATAHALVHTYLHHSDKDVRLYSVLACVEIMTIVSSSSLLSYCACIAAVSVIQQQQQQCLLLWTRETGIMSSVPFWLTSVLPFIFYYFYRRNTHINHTTVLSVRPRGSLGRTATLGHFLANDPTARQSFAHV